MDDDVKAVDKKRPFTPPVIDEDSDDMSGKTFDDDASCNIRESIVNKRERESEKGRREKGKRVNSTQS